jgi:hypothetical protein
VEKEGRSYFLEIVILLMGVGGLVRTIPSSTYFFFLLERAETGVFPPSKSLTAYTRLSWMGKQWNK